MPTLSPTFRLIEINNPPACEGYFLNVCFDTNPEAFTLQSGSLTHVGGDDYTFTIVLDQLPPRVNSLANDLTTAHSFLLSALPYGPDETFSLTIEVENPSSNSLLGSGGGNVLSQADAEGDSMPGPNHSY